MLRYLQWGATDDRIGALGRLFAGGILQSGMSPDIKGRDN